MNKGLIGILMACLAILGACQPAVKAVPAAIEDAFAKEFLNVEYMPEPRDLPVFAFQDMSGREYSSATFAAPITVVNFWATFCQPCLTELPSLAQLDETFEDVDVIGISVDPGQSPDKVNAFIKQHNINDFAGFWDHKKEARTALPSRGLPTTLLIDEKGRILYKFEGEADWMSPESLAFFKALLIQK